jgi:hypothetical protein
MRRVIFSASIAAGLLAALLSLPVLAQGITNFDTITLTDTGTLKLSGNAALGQYDNITLMSDGANWVELSETNN